MNLWLELAAARAIAADLQIKYCGQPYSMEDKMIEDLWNDPRCTEYMYLNVVWDDFDNACFIQVGTRGGMVPR